MEVEIDAKELVEEYLREKWSDVVSLALEEIPGQDGDYFHIRLWKVTLRIEGEQRIEMERWVTDTIELADYPVSPDFKPRTHHAGYLLRKFGLKGLAAKLEDQTPEFRRDQYPF